MARVVAPALSIGSGAAASETPPAPPMVQAIRIAYGVGAGRDALPTDEDFRTTYAVEIPVFSLGGLDPDGVYEFDAALLLNQLRTRATRRKWGVRLELEVRQTADSASRAAVVIESPGELALYSITGRDGETLAGGARKIVVATSVVSLPENVGRLDGRYTLALEGGEPRPINVALTRYEFEG